MLVQWSLLILYWRIYLWKEHITTIFVHELYVLQTEVIRIVIGIPPQTSVHKLYVLVKQSVIYAKRI